MTRKILILGVWTITLCACSDGAGETPTGPDDGDTPSVGLAVDVVTQGLEEPVFLTAPEGNPRLFVVELPGRIRVIEDGTLLPTPFLDITGEVRSSGGEQGLFSVAFHPDYATNGYFYVNYTAEDTGGGTRVERYEVSADPNVADPTSAKTILAVAQPFTNHNGGLVSFGPDGMLYVGMGDGGSGGDPQGNGQDPTTLLGALLRLDVDGGDPYAAPPDNPYVGDPG
ncbi:MAG: glucose dehydrogenase, partial [Gemmatimonadetes bacterium]|nr:PQQ-dependent sugar dehydrogenase [Gemmatimonadota bacterium]NIR80810.1 PQQ-dependent sugar dehydrogenase [Gemmatimonadota bacterium]NIT89630.1 PQQ-dependent sugar dehydrogenase [Gemmatimonadota bacterium]NIU33407.1 PQQ-dependent sugar dehydrogenase [Gemmatimonadota bacterium]NIU37702.1 glucose dehydrogenase [Gemmatimonadota bacterium]